MGSAPIEAGEQAVVPGDAAAVGAAGRARHVATVARRMGALLTDVGLVGGLLALTWRIGVRSTDCVDYAEVMPSTTPPPSGS